MEVAIGKNLNDILNKLGGLEKFVKKGQKVFIKPNLCCPRKPETGAVTNPKIIEQLILLLKPITKNIEIGDSSFSEFKGFEAMKASGIYKVAIKHNIKPVNLTAAKKVKKGPFIISKPILDADVIINVPVMKTHELAGVTLSIKNMMGIVPGYLKTKMHKEGLVKRIIELNQIVKPALNIVDATIGMEGRGPVNGTPKNLGLIIAGDNQVAVDSVCCKIMGIDPKMISHIKLAEKQGLGSAKNINILGWKQKYINKFELPVTYRNFLLKQGMKISGGWFREFVERNSRIEFDYSKCIKCRKCIKTCPAGALKMGKKGPICDNSKCIFCLCCFETCIPDAINVKKSGQGLFRLLKKLFKFKKI